MDEAAEQRRLREERRAEAELERVRASALRQAEAESQGCYRFQLGCEPDWRTIRSAGSVKLFGVACRVE